jgi:hypothetical protein
MANWMSRTDRAKAWKAARVTAAVAWGAASPAAVPVAQNHLDPPSGYAEYSQRVDQDRQKTWATWSNEQTKRQNAELGKRPNPAHLPGKDPQLAKAPARAAARESARTSAQPSGAPEKAAQKAPDKSREPSQKGLQATAGSPQQTQPAPQQSQSPAPSPTASRSPSRGR